LILIIKMSKRKLDEQNSGTKKRNRTDLLLDLGTSLFNYIIKS
jgi:hypothetical protein